MNARPYLRLLFCIAAVTAFALWLNNAHAQDNGHPIMGLAQVCVAEPGQPQACEVLRTDNDYDTREQCSTDMVSKLHALADAIHRDHPDWDFRAQYTCVPDTEAFNG